MHDPRQSPSAFAQPPRESWDPQAVWTRLRQSATELGFSQIGAASVDLSSAEPGLLAWLARGFHGEMHYMAQHGLKRARPAELVPGTVCVITARMDYLPADVDQDMALDGAGAVPAGRQTEAGPRDWVDREWARQADPQAAVVSVYARGRDYHKVLRNRLQKLADALAPSNGERTGKCPP